MKGWHWSATALAIVTGFISCLEQIGNQLQQLGWQLGPLAYMMPKNQGFFIGLTIASALCTFVAGIGTSILNAFKKKQQQNGTQP